MDASSLLQFVALVSKQLGQNKEALANVNFIDSAIRNVSMVPTYGILWFEQPNSKHCHSFVYGIISFVINVLGPFKYFLL